jgi:hypothetical protein
VAFSLVLVLPQAAYASVSAVADDTARVNGTVFAVAQVGDRTIIGGDFTTVGGQPRNHVAAIRANGTVDPTFNPDVNGVVRAVAGSSDGSTIYIGGTFTTAGGAARSNLAAVDAVTGAAVSSWTANTVGSDPTVLALTRTGSTLYVGGRFTGIDGTTRKRLVALNTSGNIVSGFKPGPNGTVRVVTVSTDGSRLFAGGQFGTIGGQTRSNIAELDPATGIARALVVTPVGSMLVAMGTSPSGDRLYYGTADNRVFAYDTASSTRAWTIKNGGDTQAIAATDSEVYLGGHFTNNITNKVKRVWIESVRASDGQVTAWDPKMAGGSLGVWAISTTPTSLIVGGEFTSVGGVVCRRFARFQGAP